MKKSTTKKSSGNYPMTITISCYPLSSGCGYPCWSQLLQLSLQTENMFHLLFAERKYGSSILLEYEISRAGIFYSRSLIFSWSSPPLIIMIIVIINIKLKPELPRWYFRAYRRWTKNSPNWSPGDYRPWSSFSYYLVIIMIITNLILDNDHLSNLHND